MNILPNNFYLALFIPILILNSSCFPTSSYSIKPFKDIGTYYSPRNIFKAEIIISDMGGFKICNIMNSKQQIHYIEDINGLIWINETEIIYSVSPIYGKPGIYIFNCVEKKEKLIINPKSISASFPMGSDYFELEKYEDLKKEITYFYASDIDSINFKNFRNEQNILKQKIE